MNHHSIVFGAHSIGLVVVEKLSEYSGKPDEPDPGILVVDSDVKLLAQVASKGFDTRAIDLMSDDDLRSIGIGDYVRQIFCLLRDESSNLFLILSARSLDSRLNILSISESVRSSPRLKAAGANKIINPHEIAAHRIYSVLRKPLIVDILENAVFGNANLEMTEVRVSAGSELIGKRLLDLDINHRFNLIAADVLAAEEADTGHARHLGYNYQIQSGDTLVLIGSREDLEKFINSGFAVIPGF